MAEIKEYQLFINGEWRTSTSGDTIDVLSPSTEEIVARVQNGTAEEALETLAHADKAQKE
ncbi:acyl-CoA reductase-like NAD-dependent aldehyde dehydrogenase [Flavobacterium sp. 7A]|nr:acyl-CoA reductase-like NAD-dependent aldehyde dehydrogenase [Flavobacterium sp. 7A]